MKKKWCDTVTIIIREDKSREEIKCGWQVMDLKETVIKNVSNIIAYVCPQCNTGKWLPGHSISRFLDGINLN